MSLSPEFFHNVQYYALETGTTIVFIVWVMRSVLDEIKRRK
jgi:hypothetical protein